MTVTSPGQPLVRCPSCGEQKPYSLDNPYRPFCGKGCKAIDLGAWASEQFRVPAPAQGDADLLPSGENQEG